MPNAGGANEIQVLAIHAAATLFMTGLIWVIQIVHYPLLAIVGPGQLKEYARKHAARITLIVAPVMFIELGAGAWLAATRADTTAIIALALLAVIWVSTFAVQVRLHGRLQRGDASAVALLTRSNWVRTIAWSVRGALSVLMLVRAV